MSEVTQPSQEELCGSQQAYLTVSWVFAVCWIVILGLWVQQTFCWAQNRTEQERVGLRARRPCLQLILVIVPFFHLGDAIWQLYTYHSCICMVCYFNTFSQYLAWLGSHYAFALGRLVALLLCLYIISTGAGTVRTRLLKHQWAIILLLFPAFITTLALLLPTIAAQTGVSVIDVFIASIVHDVLIGIAIVVETWLNSKVLKAQLIMIREQGVDPTTCPAWSKFKMFTRLRKYAAASFADGGARLCGSASS